MDEWLRKKEELEKWDREHAPPPPARPSPQEKQLEEFRERTAQYNQMRQMMLDIGFREEELDISKEK